MKSVQLKTIVSELESGSRPKGGLSEGSDGIPSIGGEHLNGNGGFDFSKLKCVTPEFYGSMRTGKVQRHDILIVKDGATTGKTSFVSDDFPFDNAAINEHVFRLRIDHSVADPYYVFELLRSPQGKHRILKDYRGATVGGISRGFVDKVTIPLPDRSEQTRVAAILRCAMDTCHSHAERARKCDELLITTFLERFGDPISNPREWPVKQLDDLIDKSRGISYGVVQRGPDHPSGVPLVRISNITENRFDPEGLVYTDPANSAKYKRTVIRGNEILLSIRGTVGRVAIAPESIRGSNVTREIAVVPVANGIDSRYLRLLMMTDGAQRFMSGEVRGVAQRGINLRDVRRLPVPLADPPTMREFSKLIDKHEAIQHKLETSERMANKLFRSVVQRAFRGEL